MNFFKKFNHKIMGNFGMLSISALWLAILSGLPLIIFYDVRAPYLSIQEILIRYPIIQLFRSIHYWSAQLLIIFAIFHSVEMMIGINAKEKNKIIFSSWWPAAFAFPILLFIMLSGYILKGDSEGKLAAQIFSELLWPPVKYFLLGNTNNNGWQTLYLQHASMATILLLAAVLAHAKRIWPSFSDWPIVSFLVVLLAIFFPIGLHSEFYLKTQGPWYFLPLQEILHWQNDPAILPYILLILYLFFFFFPRFSWRLRSLLKFFFSLFGLIFISLIFFVFFFRGAYWAITIPKDPWPNTNIYNSIYSYFPDKKAITQDTPRVNGRSEGCLLCHQQEFGFATSHNPKAIGCSSCHLGNIFSANKTTAHQNMILLPGNINNIEQARLTCGATNCHAEIVERVDKSLMNSMRGVIAVDRFAFGEKKIPNGTDSVKQLGGSSADTHLKQLCTMCHLGNVKKESGPINELSRGGGCMACHLNYDDGQKDNKNYHPALTLQIKSEHCFGCHSRSGRISTNYQGWHESKLTAAELPTHSSASYRLLADQRVFEKKEADVHFLAGMECIDCHTSREAMGDGNIHLHQEKQTEITCIDCHQNGPLPTVGWDQLSDEDRKIIRLRNNGKEERPRQFLKIGKSNKALPFAFLNPQGDLIMQGKNSKKIFRLKGPTIQCTQTMPGHERLACHSCHSSWAPQCLSCHTQQSGRGIWQEFSDSFLSDAPPLGIVPGPNNQEKIVPFIPGMVMTISTDIPKNKKFVRLFAPTVPHTTGKKSRSCISCHLSSNALGAGRGDLSYNSIDTTFNFYPRYSALSDQLPADAWTAFLKDGPPNSTRIDARPFNRKEQLKILNVGLCLSCHPYEEKNIRWIYHNFKRSISKMSKRCRILQ
ncbi:MAG: hypothetical protein A2451_17005 [Bdellovibrionales bacterium RIFOXYC2_FULL_39_8]|nr:MAG: hypothetical protein A2451_17005 [Bdellovibrionales bacterium RIFOXYC2_FULL_39_8]